MERLFALFNRLGRRERIGIVVILIALVYVIADLFFLSPLQKKQKALKSSVAAIENELNALRADIVVVKGQLEKDPHAKDRAQLDAYKRVMEEADTFIAKVDSDPRQVTALLREIIHSTPGVSLVSLKTLPSVSLTDSRAGGAARQQASSPPTRTIYRRGIEINIKGNYLALLPYLEKLQSQPTKVLWNEAELTVGNYPDSVLKLTIYTLSTKPEGALG